MKKSSVSYHFSGLLVVTILCGLVYAAVQQSHRSSANDPQMQIALDLKYAIENNRSTSALMTPDSIEISQSLSVFKVIYDKSGKPVESTGFLSGQMPKMPQGVFDYANSHREDVLTWQPRHGVRMATVVESINSPQIGFVAVGRSLDEVEKRISNLTTMVVVAWLVCAGIIILHFLVSYFSYAKSN